MKFSTACLPLLLAATVTNAVSIPRDATSLMVRDAQPQPESFAEPSDMEINSLEKRKGGGGGGGGGGGRSGGSSGASSGSSGGSRGSSGSSGSTSSSSNTGGRTSSGSGTAPRYPGGVYAGGASTPYRTGARSPGGVAPYFLAGAALGFFPALAIGAAVYDSDRDVTYFNQSANRNETSDVKCLCKRYEECGCDDNENHDYVQGIIGNGSNAALNESNIVKIPNGTLYIDATLANGTTAPGGTSAGYRQTALEASGWLGMIVVVASTILLT